MSDETCPLPSVRPSDDAAAISRMLAAGRIAVVGLSDDPGRPSYGVAAYLKSVGKQIIPINPNHDSILGETCYPSLEAVAGPIDLVDVFRRPEFCPDVVRSAIAVGAKGVWLQVGIVSRDAEQLARAAGLDFVQDRCLKVEHHFERKSL